MTVASIASGPCIPVLGVSVAALDAAQALAELARLWSMGRSARVYYVNAHTLNLASRDPAYQAVLRRGDLVLRDGAGVGLAARLSGRRFPANLNGTDFNPEILALAAARCWRVYFLGGRPGVARDAAERLVGRIPGLHVVGTRAGYMAQESTAQVVAEIRAARPDLLLVGLGNPLQEQWLDAHLPATGARIGVAVGGFFDFTAGRVPRAPAWMRALHVEWVFRLVQEPRRLWRRYVLGNPAFLARVLHQRLVAGRGTSALDELRREESPG